MATQSNPAVNSARCGRRCPSMEWADTCATLQLWMQVVGKIRLALTPPINHTWNVTLYPTIRGVTTSPMPCGSRMLQIDFDFLEHVLRIDTDAGDERAIPLQPMSVAAFYKQVMDALASVGAAVKIWPRPSKSQIQFLSSRTKCITATIRNMRRDSGAYCCRLRACSRCFVRDFRGKVSPVHLFWGALDLACTRFSGRTAPAHQSMPGLPDRVTRDAYSHEVSSCGFWPGAPGMDAMFYSYAYPEPPGYAEYRIEPGDRVVQQGLRRIRASV